MLAHRCYEVSLTKRAIIRTKQLFPMICEDAPVTFCMVEWVDHAVKKNEHTLYLRRYPVQETEDIPVVQDNEIPTAL